MTNFGRPRQPGAALAQHVLARNTAFEPIPEAARAGRAPPFRLSLAELLGHDAAAEVEAAGSLAFHCIGDTGGVRTPEPQKLVARGMEQSLHAPSLAPTLRGKAVMPAFCFHLGDVVYYNGEVAEYGPQFYEAYEHYPLPIVAIPGNHDGEPVADGSSTTLDGFIRNFLARSPDGRPVHLPEAQDTGRAAMSLPFVYWTLETPFLTVIGLYSNVPEHGRLDPDQRAWFQAEMAAAPRDRALAVAVHHPVFSFDNHHSGSPAMAKELEDAINASGRVPNMVLSAHVHDYQRIEAEVGGHVVPFFVIGNGGYWNLHHLAATPGYRDDQTGATLKAGMDSRHGFMTFEVGRKVINGHMTTVPRPQESWTDAQGYNSAFDVFNYTAEPLFLSRGRTATLLPADGTQVPAHTDSAAPEPPPRTPEAQRRVDARTARRVRTAA